MAQEEIEMCFENLDEFVNDENKLVTYKWLSRTLSIHVNLAKQALYSFVEQQRNEKEHDNLCVTYFVAGLIKNDGSMSYGVQLVPEQLLEAVKSSFSVVTSCHVYSVQKGKLKDSNALYMADYDALKENLLTSNKHSAITHPSCGIRTAEEVERLGQTKVSSDKTQTKASSEPAKQQNGQSHKSTVKSQSKATTETKVKKPTGIAGMFAKAESSKPATDSNNKEAETDSKNTEKKETDKAKGKAKQGGVMSFFSKQTAKPAAPKPDSEKKIPEAKKSSPLKTESPETKATSSRETGKSEKAKTGKKKKSQSDDEDPLPQQKRRRIRAQVVDSSSEEDDDEEMNIESPIPSPPAPEPEDDSPAPANDSPISTPEASPVKTKATENNSMCGKVKKRKLVSKTSLNDEGFMVTEKVWEDEWQDAPEASKEEPKKKASPPSNKPAPKSKKNPSPNSKTSPSKNGPKQTSMMSFFKKK